MSDPETENMPDNDDFDKRWEERSRRLQSWMEAATLTEVERMLLAEWLEQAQHEQQRIGESLRMQHQAHAWSKFVHHYQS